jgi:hypothetical protein
MKMRIALDLKEEAPGKVMHAEVIDALVSLLTDLKNSEPYRAGFLKFDSDSIRNGENQRVGNWHLE